MALNKDMQDLTGTVHKPIMFYLPERLFPNIDSNVIKQFEEIGLLNTLFIIDEKGNPQPIKNGVEYLKLLKKPKILKSNVFQLLEMKANLDESTFLYLLKDYTKEVDTWVSATEVIKNEAKIETRNYAYTMQSYLDLQHEVLQEHQAELKNQFGKWKHKIEFERISKLFRKTPTHIPKSKEEQKKSSIEVKVGHDVEKHSVIETKLQKKRVYISNEEADKYLLKTVFNVKV